MRISQRTRVEAALSLDLARLRRKGPDEGMWFSWHWSWGDETRISAALCLHEDRLAIEMRGATQSIPFAWKPADFGGRRRWLACPSCDRGCRVIYALNGSWRCRKCHGLAYSSQYEDEPDRVSRQMKRLFERFGDGKADISPLDRLQRLPSKPRWMHWSTYWALQARHEALRKRWTAGVAKKFKLDLGDAVARQPNRVLLKTS